MNPQERTDPQRGARRAAAFGRAADAPFDGDRALRLLRRLAFPRAVGSAGERLAARLVSRALARAGRPVARERFPVGRAARRFGSLAANVAAAALAALAGSVAVRVPALSGACALAAGALVNAPWIVSRSLAERVRPRVWSENLVAWPTTADGGDPAPARVVFLAHYDSKSQRLPTGVRVALVVSSTVGCLALAALAAAGAIAPGWSVAAPSAIIAGATVACLIALMFNASGNRSPGALDNASGLAVLLELARSWRPSPGGPLDAVFLATGAEEVGLDGARAFLQRHEWWLRERPTLLINLESVGAGDRVRLAGSASAVGLAERVARALAIPTSRFRVLGAGMDHEPFAAAGLAAVSLLGDVVGTSGALHSPRDGIHLIDRAALDRSARLASHLARAWAERHRPGEADAAPVERVRPGGA